MNMLVAGMLAGALLVVAMRTLAVRSGAAAAWDSLRSKLKGWRTVIWGALLTAAGPLVETLDLLRAVDWAQLLTPRSVAVAAALIGIVTLWLRWITTGPVGGKDGA
jgi:hypothetical protein